MVESREQDEWTILQDFIPEKPYNYEYSFAVHHSFGRGRFREVAAKVVVPKIVLDQIIGKKCWTERPRGPDPPGVGGAGPAKMGGVNTDFKPKSSGRARALHMRTQKAALAKKRPGRQVSIIHYSFHMAAIFLVEHPFISLPLYCNAKCREMVLAWSVCNVRVCGY